MAFPDTPLDVAVELAIGADIRADPSTWVWTDRSVREAPKIHINRGRMNRIGNLPPTRVTATADNTDGALCRHNPNSPYYGLLRKQTPMRVLVDNGAGPKVRAAVYVSGFPPEWDPSEEDQTVVLYAAGITDRLSRSRAVRSAMFGTQSGVSPDDYQAAFYWSLEERSGATQFASGLPGGVSIPIPGGITPGSDSSIVGSDPLPAFAAGAVLTSPTITYNSTGQFIFQFALKVAAFPVAETVYARLRLKPGGTLSYIDVSLDAGIAGSPVQVRARGYDTTGAAHGTLFTSDLLTVGADAEGDPMLITVAYGGGVGQAKLSVGVATAEVSSGITSVTTLDNASDFGSWQLRAGLACVFGHPTLYTDPTIVLSNSDFNREGLSGWAGEMAHVRAARLCRELRIPFTTLATRSQAMGPQPRGKIMDLLRDCANADLALLIENFDFGLTFVSGPERFNLSAAMTLDYAAGQILAPWKPADDDQDYANNVTASRPTGSSYRIADEDDVDEVGEYTDPVNPNVHTDAQLRDVAGMRFTLGRNDELTWPAVKPNLFLGGALLDAWLDIDLGQHMHMTGHPSPLAPDTIRQVLEGYSETLSSSAVDVSANLSPATPWDANILDDATLGKIDTAGCVMQAGATSGATSFTVHTTVPLKWNTDAVQMPIPILVSGQINNITAVTDVTPAFVAAGTAAHAVNTSVTPGMPAGTQAGDLLLVWAAVRNSGAGTVDTPAGYTQLLASGNVALLGKVHTGTEVAPTVTVTGGVANADVTAQMAAVRGVGITVHSSAAQLNGSAQDIAVPQLDVSRPACMVLQLGWKADDWTSVAAIAGATEIGEPDTTTGDDQGIVWDYRFQTTAARVAATSFVVTGGAAAISRGLAIALATDVQTLTVTRAVNGVQKSIPIESPLHVHRAFQLSL